ncbi:MAG TPA: hypothetical protein VFH61_11095 [Thermoleophilia bacterium]|nr:hypothetical protein [Thermoleophilia bacterium]
MTTTHITADAINAAISASPSISFTGQVRQDDGSYKDTLDILAIGEGYAIAKTHRTGVIAMVQTRDERNDGDFTKGYRAQYGWAVAARVTFAVDTGDLDGTLCFDDANAYAARININLATQL